MNVCKRIIEFDSGIDTSYHLCNNKAKYKVSYKNALNGKLETEYLCGIHFNSLKKASYRLLDKYKYDDKLIYAEL
tara:strand:+ start:465 stop:689 length:225 start_codon:yes stop_codon:yes gene_type:complete